MIKGQVVTALLFGGTEAPRRVVADKGDIVVVCSEEEYQFAIAAKREPNGVGFPRADVIENGKSGISKKSASSEFHSGREQLKAGG